jgi:hypothetical protein
MLGLPDEAFGDDAARVQSAHDFGAHVIAAAVLDDGAREFRVSKCASCRMVATTCPTGGNADQPRPGVMA